MKSISWLKELMGLFDVQTAPPTRSRWLWFWGGFGLFCGGLALIELIPETTEQTLAPVSSIAFSQRALQVALLGLWIALRQPWRSANTMEQHRGWMLNIIGAVLLIPAVGTVWLDPDPWESLWHYAVLIMALLQIIWLSRRGLVRLAATLLIVTLLIYWLGLGGLVIDPGGIPIDIAMILLYSLIILIGGLLVKWWFGLLMALALPLFLFGLNNYDLIAILPNRDTTLLYVMLLIANAGIVALYTRTLETALITANQRNVELHKAQDTLAQANEELKRSELQLRTIISNNPVILFVLDRNGIFTLSEGAGLEHLALKPGQVVGQSALELYRDYPEVVDTLRQALAGQISHAVHEMGFVTYDVYYSPVYDDQGQLDGVIGVATDITERKRTEQALQQATLVVENSPVVLFRWRAVEGWPVELVSQNVTQFGYQPQELLSGAIPYAALVHPDDLERVGREVRQHSASGADRFQQEYRIITQDGQVRWVDDRTVIVRDADGNLTHYQGIVMDVTERVQAEQALQESEARYRNLFEYSPISLWEEDFSAIKQDMDRLQAEGVSDWKTYFDQHPEVVTHYISLIKVLNVNLAALELYQADSKQDLIDIQDVITDDVAPVLLSKALSAFAEGQTHYRSEAPQSTLTGDKIFVVGNTIIIPGYEHSWSRVIVSSVDITERKRAEEALQESEEQYRTLAQNLPDSALMLFNRDLCFILADGPEIEAMGFSREMLEGKTLQEALPIEFAQLVEQNIRRTLNGDKFYVELPYEDRFYRYSYVPLHDSSGKVVLVMILATNITERKRMEDRLFEEKERAEVTLHSIGDGVITTDIHARVEYLNPVAENLTGWKLEEAIGQPLENIFQLIEESSRQPALSPVERCLQEEKVIGLANHSILINRNGREFAIADSAAPIRNHNREIIGVVLIFRDVTEQRQLSQKIAYDAAHDELTSLINRREFEKRLERALINAKEHNASHVFCYLDLDHFKIVNDTAGHAAGDELLKQISGLTTGLFRQRDTFARLGGDEFGLLLENCDLDRALIIANEIRAKIRDFPFIWEGHGFQIGVSIGVVPITAEKESISQLLSQADIACYSAKDLGRDRVCVYQAADSETTQQHNEILQAACMNDALIHDKFQLFCQPITHCGGKHTDMMQYEVLLRMDNGDEHLVLPGAFIPSAERYGLMPAIDRWVIEETFLAMAQHGVEGLLININISGNSLNDENLIGYVLGHLSKYSIPPDQICFEIAETTAIHHLSKAQHFMHVFRERGGKIALDDFGSGFSSFKYLKSLSVDYIKIDGSFVSDMLSNPGDLLMVKAITQIAHTLGIQVIAEHVTNHETIQHLQEISIDYAQGFGVGRPVPLKEAWAN